MPRTADSAKPRPAGRWLGYATALLLGAVAATSMFPRWALTGGIPPGGPPVADFAQQVVGQRYFLAAAWHWPLLTAPGLMTQAGVNIAFTDSNPLAILAAKLVRPLLPPFDQVVTIWQVLCWVLQPIAAVFALRGAGERRLLPAVAVAVMAASQPVFLAQLWHAQLDSHFIILGMIGLYFRAVRGSRRWFVAACCALPPQLLIHPYIAAMNAPILAAIPITLAWRRDPAWRRSASGVAMSVAAVAALAIVLGYTASSSPGGYGFYSMNLLSPLYPARSALISGLADADIDGTGGQYAGYNYLGAGLLLLLAAAGAMCWPAIRAAIRRHRGLMLGCAGLLVVALSNRVYVGHHLLFKLHTAVGPLQILRASGRLFWPIAYVLLIGGVAALAANRRRLALFLLPLATLLQYLDGAGLRANDYARLHDPQPWLFDPAHMRTLTASAKFLVVLPVYGCTPDHDMPLMQVLWIGSETLVPTNTMYVARRVQTRSCDLTQALAAAPAPGVLLVLQPGFRDVLAARPWAQAFCRELGEYSVCTQNTAMLSGFAPLRDIP
jgi:hypothetical protein